MSFYELLTEFEEYQLHVFCNASRMSHGVCCYLVEGVQSKLIYAKSRINPKSKEYSLSIGTVSNLSWC